MNRGIPIKLIHFFPSHESKFQEQAKKFFERDFLENEWIGFSKEDIDRLAAGLCPDEHKKFDWIVFHSAPMFATRAICLMSEKSRVLVQFWGADYTSVLMGESRLYLPCTHREFIGAPFPRMFSGETLANRWYLLKNRLRRNRYIKSFEKCEHLCFALGASEWKWMPEAHQTKCVNWFVNYSEGNEFTFDVRMKEGVKKGGVLLGNSAAATNNHLDVLEKLQRSPKRPSKIIIPLSYGPKSIATRVKDVATKNFGDAVMAVMNFMPQQAYFALLDQCEFVIMGQMRQQALGNLKWAFSTLRTVYLWEDSDMFEYFNSHGFAINSIDSIEHQGMVPIPKERLEHNKALAREHLLNFFETDVKATLTNAQTKAD